MASSTEDPAIVTSTSASSLRALGAVFGQLSPGQAWEQETHQALKIRQLLKNSVPSAFAGACEAWVDDQGGLVIACSNGAVATKIKQYSPRILHHFRASGAQVSSIRVEVQAERLGLTAPARRPGVIPPPAFAAVALESLAARTRAPELAAAIARLAQGLRARSDPD